MTQPDRDVRETAGMQFAELRAAIPEALVQDFASDPLAPFDKVLKKAGDPTWPLYTELNGYLASLPTEAVDAAFENKTFVALYGKNDRVARFWMTERFLVQESARRRLDVLTGPASTGIVAPYDAACLQATSIDEDGMVRVADFSYNNATLGKDGFSFTVFSTTDCPNSTYWLLRSFYEESVADHVRVRLDPFLWGPSDSYPQTMYKMLVYATPVDWESLGQLREPAHGMMQADKPPEKSELTEFCWTRRDDGIHLVCEELPPKERIEFVGARYLHAIYAPSSQSITHFDGALRIYSDLQYNERRSTHVRHSGKTGIRKKIFRIDAPTSRSAFSLITQAFFVWNDDLVRYFRERLPG